MTNYEIEQLQKQIATTLKDIIHPDNVIAHAMTARYRQLETLKQEQL